MNAPAEGMSKEKVRGLLGCLVVWLKNQRQQSKSMGGMNNE